MKLISKILLILLIGTSSLLADFKSITTNEMQTAIKNGIAIIDIRRVDEYKEFGVIQNSYQLTFFDGQGNYDIQKWLKKFTKIVTSKDQPFILVCAHANRTKVVAQFLDKKLKYKHVQDLQGGIIYGWIDKGKKTISYK